MCATVRSNNTEHRTVSLLQQSVLSTGGTRGTRSLSAFAVDRSFRRKPARCDGGFRMVLYGSLDADVSVAVTASCHGCGALTRRGWSGLVVLRYAHSEDFAVECRTRPVVAHTLRCKLAICSGSHLSFCVSASSHSRLTAF